MEEIWLDIIGFEGLYQVSSIGNVKRLTRTIKNGSGVQLLEERPLKTYLSKRGYPFLILRKDNRSINKYIHRLVAESFIGKSDLQVNHINGIKTDNRVENLEFVTNRENNTHRFNKEGHLTGAHFSKKANKWQSAIKVNKQNINLGYFDNQLDAHLAYIQACEKYSINNKYSSINGR